MELWNYKQISSKDSYRNSITLGDVVEQLAEFVKADDNVGFSHEVDRLFLGGAWGFLFKILNDAPGGYHWHTFARDIRGLLWACLKHKI